MTRQPLLLPGFEYRRVDVESVTISCAIAGSGPPLPEQAPDLVTAALREFLGGRATD